MTKSGGTKAGKSIFLLAGLFAAFIVGHAVLVLSGNHEGTGYRILERTWGFDHLSYFPVPVAVLVYVVGLLLIVLPLNLKLGLVIERIVQAKRAVLISLGRRKVLLYFVVSACSGAAFYVFRVKYDLLGDTLIRATQTLSRDFHLAEYGSMFALYQLVRALEPLGITAREAFVGQSVVAGVGFVLVSLLVADSLGRTFLTKTAIFVFSVTIGTIQQFFGYPEIYAIPAVLWLAYIYCCILYLKGKVGLAAPLASLIASLVFHLVSLALIPSVLVLIRHRYPGGKAALSRVPAKYVALAFVIALPLLYLGAGLTSYELMPVQASAEQPSRMTLFSVPHLWEFFNSQLLAAGAGIFLFGYVFYRYIRARKAPDPVLSLLMSVSFASVLLLFIFEATLGSNDWDLYTFPAIAYSLLGMYYLTGTGGPRSVTVRYAVPILIFFNLINVVPWILINASDLSVERIKRTLPTDPGLYWMSHPPAMHLAIAFEANGLADDAFLYYRKYHRENPDDIRGHFNYAKQLINRGDRDEGIRELENLMDISPYSPWAYQALVVVYERSGEYDKIYGVLKRMFGAYTNNPRPFRELVERDELMAYLDFLYEAELEREDETAAEAVRKAIDATARYYNKTPR